MTPISVDPTANEPADPTSSQQPDALSTRPVTNGAHTITGDTSQLRHVLRELAKRREIDRARETSTDQGLSAADLL